MKINPGIFDLEKDDALWQSFDDGDEIIAGSEEKIEGGTLRELCPISWFHDRGRHRLVARLIPRLPDVSGSLFLTMTADNEAFGHDGEEAFNVTRAKIRKVFDRLRDGVMWQGKLVRINAAYCVKVEFLPTGFAHYHLVVLTSRYLDKHLLEHLWGYGFCNVKRISNEDFHYLLKYVTKDNGPLPDWVLKRKRIRIFQTTEGFYKDDQMPGGDVDAETVDQEETSNTMPSANPAVSESSAEIPSLKNKSARELCTIAERIAKWHCTAVYKRGVHYSQIILSAPFHEIFAQIIFRTALEGRYLGNNEIKITEPKQLEPWLNYKKTAA